MKIIQNSKPSAIEDELRTQDAILKYQLSIHDKLEAVMKNLIRKLERKSK